MRAATATMARASDAVRKETRREEVLLVEGRVLMAGHFYRLVKRKRDILCQTDVSSC
jgi:hypothetical protein